MVETLFESELFGHVRGAFTGATIDKAGVFESANGGTVFLDEAGELPLGAQAKLLRTLENGEMQRVGSVDLRKVDVRVVGGDEPPARSAKSPPDDFGAILYYRLNVVEIAVPPLRERLGGCAVPDGGVRETVCQGVQQANHRPDRGRGRTADAMVMAGERT